MCLSPEGRADLRQAALRWLQSAPSVDETWEYHASRQPSPDARTLEIDGIMVDFAEMAAISSWDLARRRVDVRLWHPVFERIPEPARMKVGFLFLDSLLGEDDVERWIGSIDLLESPTGGRTPGEFKTEVDRRRAEPPADDRWVLGTLEGRSGPIVVLADAALKRIDHPFADLHVAITVVLEDGGLPGDSLAAELNVEEDDLVARMQDAAVYAGRTTRPGARTMHFVAENEATVRAVIDAWAQVLPPRRIKVDFEADMDWTFRARELGLG